MDQNRGILFLADPMRAESAIQMKSEHTDSITLIFDGNERYLSLAQAALWRIRQRCSWVCVAADRKAACIAVALAAQLPVDRLALMDSSLFLFRRKGMPRELARLEAYARRNLSLVVSEILLLGCRESEVKAFLYHCRNGKTCVLAEDGKCRESGENLLVAPWERVCRKNLLIPTKCV